LSKREREDGKRRRRLSGETSTRDENENEDETRTCFDLTTSLVHIARAMANPGTMMKRYQAEIEDMYHLWGEIDEE